MVKIFFSYATADLEKFQISFMAEELEKKPNIEKVYYWDRDSSGSIIEYMSKSIEECDTCIFFYSKNAIGSGPIQKERDMAVYKEKHIIPLFTDIHDVPLILQTETGININGKSIQDICKEIYRLISIKYKFSLLKEQIEIEKEVRKLPVKKKEEKYPKIHVEDEISNLAPQWQDWLKVAKNKEKFSKLVDSATYQKTFDNMVKSKKFPIEVELKFEKNSWLFHGKFTSYPNSPAFSFVSCHGMTDIRYNEWIQQYKAKNFILIWHQEFLIDANNSYHQATCITI